MQQAGRLTRRAVLAGAGATVPALTVMGQSASGTYYLQAGEFHDATAAANLAAGVQQRGVRAIVVSSGNAKLVLIGGFDSKDEALAQRHHLAGELGLAENLPVVQRPGLRP